MHIYSKTISTITWADIQQFCSQGIAENTYLEYKVDFPNDLSKVVAAMANTFGGVILIGVEETDSGTPKMPVVGVQVDRGLEERVLNTILDTMSPPVLPEIGTCLSPDKARAVLVIRVPQSELAPHALQRNSNVYIRTGKRNKPEDFADLDRIDWLRDRRKKSDDLREWIFDRACARFRSMRDGQVGDVPRTDEGKWGPSEEQPGLLTVALSPLYPDRILAKPAKLDVIRRNIRVRDYIGTSREFPLQDAGCVSRIVEDGFVMHISGQRGLRTYHTHLNIHGLFLFRQSLLYKLQKTQEEEEDNPSSKARIVIRGYEILARLYEVIESGEKFYKEIGYWGPLKFRLKLDGLLGRPLLMPESDGGRIFNVERYSADPQIDTFHVLQSSSLENEKDDAVLPLFERVGWAFDSHVTSESLRALYAAMRAGNF